MISPNFPKTSSSSPLGAAGQGLLWLLAWAPALLVLWWIWEMRIRIPYHDSWAFVEQYQKWMEGAYSLRDFLQPHNGHPAIPGKLVYFAALHWLDGDVSVLPFVAWGLSLVISGSVYLLARPLWQGGGHWFGPVLMFLANLSIFTGAQGHTWVWDFVFQNFFPGASFAAALAILRSTVQWRTWRGLAAFALALIAAFSFGSGFLVGFLLLPMVGVALPSEWGGRKKLIVLFGWFLAMVFVTWLAMSATHSVPTVEPKEELMEGVASRPVMALSYVLVLCGHTLGQGTVVEAVTLSLWIGAGLVTLLGASVVQLLVRCRTRQGWHLALPWVLCCLWAVGNAGIICIIRMGSLLETALAPRYATFVLFMVLGVVFLVASLWYTPALRDLVPSSLRSSPALPVGAGLLLAGHLSGWLAGHQSLLAYHARMVSEAAAADFLKVLPVNREIQWDTDDGLMTKLLLFLADQDRLKGVKFLPDTRISNLKQGMPLLDKYATFELTRRESDGRWMASGLCALSKDRVRMAHLILLTATVPGEEERLIAFTAPRLPDDFFQRMILRRQFSEHYLGWSYALDPAKFPAGVPVQLKAYAYDAGTRRIRPIPGGGTLTF